MRLRALLAPSFTSRPGQETLVEPILRRWSCPRAAPGSAGCFGTL
jgi:hypothetical protein